MFVRALATLAAVLTLPASVAAEPPKTPVVQQPVRHPAVVELASAETLRPAALPQHPEARPAKRAMRVTTCRCGDPQAAPDPEPIAKPQ